MKTFRKFVEEEIANAVSGGNIAGISDVPPNDPPVFKNATLYRRKKKMKQHQCPEEKK